jgi:hypothetical protein
MSRPFAAAGIPRGQWRSRFCGIAARNQEKGLLSTDKGRTTFIG